jgi:outer membrane protein OmpU
MDKMKKLGLTALAGSLVATSAFAGSMDVSGSAKITYVSHDEKEVTGNSFSNSKGITFSGSGDLDNGMSVSTSYAMTDAAFSVSTVVVDMGDSGTIGLYNGTSGGGIGKISDKMPTAGEQVWDDVDTTDNGVVGISNANNLAYNASFGDVTVSAQYTNDGSGAHSDSGWSLQHSGLVDGMTIGIGMADDGTATDEATVFVTYVVGGITIGYQRSDIDYSSGSTNDEERNHVAASVAVNENLSVSYGRSEVDMGAGKVDEESSGVSASYTMGSITVAAISNATDNVSGTAGTDDTYNELSIAFAF